MVRRNKAPEGEEEIVKVTPDDLARSSNGFADTRLLSFVERIERLTEEARAITDDRKEVFDEAKAHGFDTKVMRKIIARRNMDSATRKELDNMMDLYEEAISRAQKRQIAELDE